MKVIMKSRCLVLVPEDADDKKSLDAWEKAHRGQVFIGMVSPGNALLLSSLGPREEACREPVFINSRVADPKWRLISNFGHAPFTLDGREYANVEGFWQGLKFESEEDRRRLAMMTGSEARRVGQERGYGTHFFYEGQTVVPGTWDHWVLMERACRAKFTQDPAAKASLLSTGNRPLEHRMRHDSRSIPGALMAEIWMRIRDEIVHADTNQPA